MQPRHPGYATVFAGLIEAAITRQRELLIPIDESALRRKVAEQAV